MALQAALLLFATVIIAVAILQARRQPGIEPESRLRLWWGLFLVGYVGYMGLNYVAALGLLGSDPAAAADLGLDDSVRLRGLLAMGLVILTALYAWFLVTVPAFRRHLTRIFPAPVPALAEDAPHSWLAQQRGFDPVRPVHAMAFCLALLFFIQNAAEYILAGGQTGVLTSSVDESSVLVSSILTAIMFLGTAFAGVGAGADRTWRAALERLGLRTPTLSELTVAVGASVSLVVFLFCAGQVWLSLVPQQEIQQQTQLSQAIAGSVTTLGAAFLVAFFSSVGEEIAFRGALQPVLGLWPTTLLFALAHLQYQFSPAALIILVVGAVLGLLRRYFGTVSAIAAHFLYNFTLLSLTVLASQLISQ